jgi:hypothetical protein
MINSFWSSLVRMDWKMVSPGVTARKRRRMKKRTV